MTPKPHIFFRRGWWFCHWRSTRSVVQRSGKTPVEAYANWFFEWSERYGSR
jgi:hypothetical protein